MFTLERPTKTGNETALVGQQAEKIVRQFRMLDFSVGRKKS